MKLKKLIFIFTLTSFSLLFAQNDDAFMDSMGFKEKVLINWKLKSYSTSVQKTINGVKQDMYFPTPNLNDPFIININSSSNKGQITVLYNESKDKAIIEFSSIYKKSSANEIVYAFSPIDNRIVSILYYKRPGQNDTLIVTIQQDANNSTMLLYTISNL